MRTPAAPKGRPSRPGPRERLRPCRPGSGPGPRPDGESPLRGGFGRLLRGYANHWFSVHTPSEPRDPTNVRFGSQADVKRHSSRCLLSGVKRTSPRLFRLPTPGKGSGPSRPPPCTPRPTTSPLRGRRKENRGRAEVAAIRRWCIRPDVHANPIPIFWQDRSGGAHRRRRPGPEVCDTFAGVPRAAPRTGTKRCLCHPWPNH